jgi:hypothetical protein
MTRPSERELRQTIESIDDGTSDDAPARIVIETTIVGTDWQPPAGSDVNTPDLDAGETATEQRTIELSGADR